LEARRILVAPVEQVVDSILDLERPIRVRAACYSLHRAMSTHDHPRDNAAPDGEPPMGEPRPRHWKTPELAGRTFIGGAREAGVENFSCLTKLGRRTIVKPWWFPQGIKRERGARAFHAQRRGCPRNCK
jgi:hypothetical protein